MSYETRASKISNFTAGTPAAADTIDFIQSGINKRGTIQQLLDLVASVYGASLRTYEYESELVADNIALGEYAIVEENNYSFYKITNIAATGDDIALDSGLTAEFEIKLKQENKYDSVAALIASSPSTDSGEVISYYGGWQDTDAGPQGGFEWHKTGGTNSSPTVGTAVSVGSIGGGDENGDTTGQSVQAGYFWCADGTEVRISESKIYFEQLGAVGDNVADDFYALRDAINIGGDVNGTTGKTYRITDGLTIPETGTVVDLNRAWIRADFSTGDAVTVGDGLVKSYIGIRNGTISTDNTSTSLNGLVFADNARRRVVYDKMRVRSFKGTGVYFTDLNWSLQETGDFLIEGCGVGMHCDDDTNTLVLTGTSIDSCTTGLVTRGVFNLTIVGGYIQFCDVGMSLETGEKQNTQNPTLIGVYFEDNDIDIHGENGRALVVHGCYFRHESSSDPVIELESWVGADIRMNFLNGLSTVGADFVNADSSCSLIAVGPQSTLTSANIKLGGSNDAYVEAFGAELSSAPVASLLNRGSLILVDEGDFARPYMCMTTAASARDFVQLGLATRKQSAQAASSPLTPNYTSLTAYDLTVAAALTINLPTGSYSDGDKLSFILKQTSGGGNNVTFHSNYITTYTNTGNSGNTYCTVEFMYSEGRSRWVQQSIMTWT